MKNDTACTVKSNGGLPWQKQHSRKSLFINKLTLNLKKKLVKCYIWSITLYGAETWALRKLYQECLESFEMWCWSWMVKISLTDLVKNEEALHRAKGERSILRTMKRRLTGLVTSCMRNASQNTLLRGR